MYDVTGKVVFLTGGAQGLGKSYCHALLQMGAKVFFGDLDPVTGAATEAEFSTQFGKENVRFTQFDVTDSAKFEEAFRAAVLLFGHIDIMVNNAGILNEGVWELMIGINYTATVRGTKFALDHMRKDKGGQGGRIINISSVVGLIDHYSQPVYVGTKHAVRSFTCSIAMEPGLEDSTGVSLAVLCPGVTATDLILKLDDTKMHDYSSVMKPRLDQVIQGVDVVTSAFVKLLQLDEMNAALILATKEGPSFRKMTHESLKLL